MRRLVPGRSVSCVLCFPLGLLRPARPRLGSAGGSDLRVRQFRGRDSPASECRPNGSSRGLDRGSARPRTRLPRLYLIRIVCRIVPPPPPTGALPEDNFLQARAGIFGQDRLSHPCRTRPSLPDDSSGLRSSLSHSRPVGHPFDPPSRPFHGPFGGLPVTTGFLPAWRLTLPHFSAFSRNRVRGFAKRPEGARISISDRISLAF